MRILLADDESALLNFLERGLRAQGYECASLSELHEVLPCSPMILMLNALDDVSERVKGL